MRSAALLAVLLAAPVLVLPAVAQPAPAGASWSQDPSSGCRFTAPKSLTAGPTFWTGTCKDGLATGLGMLRRRDGNTPGPAFYGDMQAGVPKIGAIDLDGGFVVGQFKDGDIGQGEVEPNDRINGFTTAAKAALAVSASYKVQNNAASARHYEGVAKTLALQADF
ncbi:hypothetical protein GCM10007301_21020 [Azorhizobium oxalatiphilum]|uniref:Uncharacterized protein n=1 Tax=Azorhizobium oxalatiphilum TaxID=980631 RepID=A0A917BZ40_9HYPH|nr:hypothetical protein [Azorhizobium oxalatiphilum]GGF61026.1 hypothetical protein GCM10007301_21020 [Azorhizobium oxalatiphilum]